MMSPGVYAEVSKFRDFIDAHWSLEGSVQARRRSTTESPTGAPPQLTAGNITLVKPLGENDGADFINVEAIQNNTI